MAKELTPEEKAAEEERKKLANEKKELKKLIQLVLQEVMEKM